MSSTLLKNIVGVGKAGGVVFSHDMEAALLKRPDTEGLKRGLRKSENSGKCSLLIFDFNPNGWFF